MTHARNLARLARQGAPVVDAAQALRDLPIYNGLYPEVVQTLGCLSSGDGGHGAWRWDAASVSDDNVGTVLLPTGHSGTGRWVALPQTRLDLRRFCGVGQGTARDDTVGIQAALDAMKACGGGVVTGAGDYGITGIIIPSEVAMIGDGPSGCARRRNNNLRLSVISGAGNATRAVQMSESSSIERVWVEGGGLGSDVLVGISTPPTTGAKSVTISDCFVQNFPDQGIVIHNGSLRCLVQDNLVQSVLLNRTYPVRIGALQVGGTDNWVIRGEYTASTLFEETVTSPDLNCAAVVISMSSGWVQDVVAEISDTGFFVSGAWNRFTGCRGDSNYGHGWIISGAGNQFAACLAHMNSFDESGVWDGWYVTGNRNHFTGCLAWSVPDRVMGTKTDRRHRYGANDLLSGDVGKNIWSDFRSHEHADGAMFNNASAASLVSSFSGAAVLLEKDNPTPSVAVEFLQYSDFFTNNTNELTYTNFLGGFNGQIIRIRCQGQAIFLDHGDYIKVPNYTSLKLSQHESVEMRNDNGVWYLVSSGMIASSNQYWVDPAGTRSRSSFNPSSVTLEQLGQRVAALIDDLETAKLVLKT